MLFLGFDDWRRRAELVEKEIEKWVCASSVEMGRIVFKEVDTKFNIISSVARRVAWSNPGRVTVVVNKGYFEDLAQVYIREFKVGVDLSWIIDFAVGKGFSAGGRSNVVGVVLPREELDGFLTVVLNRLRGCLKG